MKSVTGSNGRRTVTCRIAIPLDIKLLTIYALDMLLDQKNPVDTLLQCNKREIFILARLDITKHGRYTAPKRVEQFFNETEITRAEEHVRCMFPEVD